MAGSRLECDRTGDHEIDLGSRRRGTQYIETRGNPFGALVHARQSPMPLPSRPDHVLIHTATIIPDNDANSLPRVFQHSLDATGAGMPVRIHEGFPRYPVNILPDSRA